MSNSSEKSRFLEGDLVEFVDYQDLKHYTGVVKSIIHSSTDPLTAHTYVLGQVNFGARDSQYPSHFQDSIQVIERNILRKLERLSPDFFLKNGWYLSLNPNHPQNLYIKNTYPIAFQFDQAKDIFWVYNANENVSKRL